MDLIGAGIPDHEIDGFAIAFGVYLHQAIRERLHLWNCFLAPQLRNSIDIPKAATMSPASAFWLFDPYTCHQSHATAQHHWFIKGILGDRIAGSKFYLQLGEYYLSTIICEMRWRRNGV
jgi:hypothetical protein